VGRRERPANFETRVRYEWVAGDKHRLTGKYPIGTEQHIRGKTIRDGEVHSGKVEAANSRDLDVDRRVLDAGYIKGTGEIEIINNRSGDLR